MFQTAWAQNTGGARCPLLGEPEVRCGRSFRVSLWETGRQRHARGVEQGRGWGPRGAAGVPEETAGIAVAPRPGREGLGEKDSEQGARRYPGRSHDGSASKSYKFDFFKKDRLFF